MSQVVLYLNREVHLSALEVAETSEPPAPESAAASLINRNLYAPITDDARHWLERLWGVFKQALLSAASEGYEKAKPVIAKFNDLLQQAQSELESGLQQVRDQLIERVNTYIKTLLKLALGSVESTINVGGRDMQVINVTLQQSLKMSGSVSLSITDICQFVSEGQLTISAQYGVSAPNSGGA